MNEDDGRSWLLGVGSVDVEGALSVRRPGVGAEISNTEETVEALTAGLGVCPIAAGNAPLIARDGIVLRPVTGVTSSELVR